MFTLFLAFPLLTVSEIELCGKDGKKKPSYFNSSFQSSLNSDTVLPPPHFICVARGWYRTLALHWLQSEMYLSNDLYNDLSWIYVGFASAQVKKKSVLQDLKVLPNQKRQTHSKHSAITFSNLVQQYHTCKGWLAVQLVQLGMAVLNTFHRGHLETNSSLWWF